MTDSPIFTAFITKYALTEGIEEIEARILSSSPSSIESICARFNTYYHHAEWHRTREEAVAQAEKMRVKKIASLKAKIAKLEGTVFK